MIILVLKYLEWAMKIAIGEICSPSWIGLLRFPMREREL